MNIKCISPKAVLVPVNFTLLKRVWDRQPRAGTEDGRGPQVPGSSSLSVLLSWCSCP